MNVFFNFQGKYGKRTFIGIFRVNKDSLCDVEHKREKSLLLYHLKIDCISLGEGCFQPSEYNWVQLSKSNDVVS